MSLDLNKEDAKWQQKIKYEEKTKKKEDKKEQLEEDLKNTGQEKPATEITPDIENTTANESKRAEGSIVSSANLSDQGSAGRTSNFKRNLILMAIMAIGTITVISVLLGLVLSSQNEDDGDRNRFELIEDADLMPKENVKARRKTSPFIEVVNRKIYESKALAVSRNNSWNEEIDAS